MTREIAKIIHLEATPSTNAHARQLLADGQTLPDITLIYADAQTAGRGQKGNHWESAPLQNVAFSLVCHPDFVQPARQFVLSEAIALAVAEGCEAVCPGLRDEGGLAVKWPNDVYLGDRKLSGTLIECDLVGASLANCVIGTGVNVNQTRFLSDAPNPVSLKQACGRDLSTEAVLRAVCRSFVDYYNRIGQGRGAQVHGAYMSRLYRREGFHEFEDAGGRFRAAIEDVAPTGHLLLRRADGTRRSYEFKEVRFVLPHTARQQKAQET